MNTEKELERREEAKKPVLEVHNLKSYYQSRDGEVPAVDGVDLTLYPGVWPTYRNTRIRII